MGTKWGDTRFSDFTIHRIAKDEAGSETGVLYNYYEYIHALGYQLVMREKIDETEYLYAEGAFTDRATLSYDGYDKLA